MAYFAASCDTPELNKKFAKKLELDYPILSDPSRKVAKAYGVVNEKRRFPFRKTIFIGKDGTILYIETKVNTGDHGNQVAKKLKELKVEAK